MPIRRFDGLTIALSAQTVKHKNALLRTTQDYFVFTDWRNFHFTLIRASCVNGNMTNIAINLIEKLGGVSAVATTTKVHVSRVYRWTYGKERGGTGGEIPKKHWPALIAAARQRGIELSHEDFFQIPIPAKPRGKK